MCRPVQCVSVCGGGSVCVGEASRAAALSAGRTPIAGESAGAQTFLQRRGLFMQGKVLREGGWVRVPPPPTPHSLGGAVVSDVSKKQTKARYWILGALCWTAAPASGAQGPFLPRSHIKVALAQRGTSTPPPPPPRCSCLPVWVMNVYFTYRLSVCGLNGCHISNPSEIRTMCCHCNLKHPGGFFLFFSGLVWF